VFDAAPRELVSAKDWALARIRTPIHSGEFRPGVKLSIDTLAAELGVSRTPVRDAFGQLEREGLVTITSRVGVFVRRLTRSEAEDIYGINEAVEPLMARWAAERPSAARRAAGRRVIPVLDDLTEGRPHAGAAPGRGPA
jgi:DNA-binding GntR family transcriptional regulator